MLAHYWLPTLLLITAFPPSVARVGLGVSCVWPCVCHVPNDSSLSDAVSNRWGDGDGVLRLQCCGCCCLVSQAWVVGVRKREVCSPDCFLWYLTCFSGSRCGSRTRAAMSNLGGGKFRTRDCSLLLISYVCFQLKFSWFLAALG